MKYIKHIFREIAHGLGGIMRRTCGRLSEDGRIRVILSMLLVLVIGNWYFAIHTLRHWGEKEGREEMIMPELIDAPLKGFLFEADSINNQIILENGEGTTENG